MTSNEVSDPLIRRLKTVPQANMLPNIKAAPLEARSGARQATPIGATDRSGSSDAQTGAARSRLPRAPVPRSQPARL